MWEKFVNLFDSFGKIAAAVAAVLGLYAAYVQLNSSVAPPPRNEASVPASAPASPSVPVLATLPSEPRSEPQETRKVDRPVAAAEQKHPQPTSPSYQWSYPAGTAETNVIVTTMPASDEKQGGSNETEADEATGPKLSKPGKWKPGECFNKTPQDQFSETITLRDGDYVLCFSDGTQLANLHVFRSWVYFRMPGGGARVDYGNPKHGNSIFGTWEASALKIGTSDANYQARLSFTLYPK